MHLRLGDRSMLIHIHHLSFKLLSKIVPSSSQAQKQYLALEQMVS